MSNGTTDSGRGASPRGIPTTYRGEAIIVGQSPTLTGSTNAWNDCHHGGSPLGLLGEYYPDVDQFCWGAASAIECTECMSLGFCHAYQSFRNRVCGHYDGDHYLGEWSDELRDALWATAVNATQWNP